MNQVNQNIFSKFNWGVVIKWGLTPIILFLLAYLGYQWLENNKPTPEQRPNRVKKVKVFTMRTEVQDTQLIGYSQGQVMPTSRFDLKNEVEGKVIYLSPNMVAGGVIQQDEVLLQIDPREYELAVIQKRARVAQTEQLLARAQAESEAAQQELASLGREQASELAKGIPQLKQAQAGVESAKAELALAELNLKRTKIISPFTGRVEKENLNLNQYINRNTNLATIFSTEVMEIRLSMTPEQFAQIQLPVAYYQDYEMSKFPVRLYSEIGDSEVSWYGKIVRTEAVMDNRTRTIYAVAQVKDGYLNQSSPLLSGLFVYAEVSGGLVENATELPKNALRNNSALWIVDNEQKLKIISADVIQRTPDSIIVANLPPNTLVITSALAIPTEGLKVVPIMQKRTQLAEQPKSSMRELEKHQTMKSDSVEGQNNAS